MRHCDWFDILEFVLKKKRKKGTSFAFEHRKSTIRKMLVRRETNSVTNPNTKSMNTGVRCTSSKLSILCRSFDAIQSNAVAHGDRITLKYFPIDFFRRLCPSNELLTAFEWPNEIIRKANSTDRSFNVFNSMASSFKTPK